MSTQPPAPVPMTPAELTALMAKTAGEVIGPALEAALEPFKKATNDTLEGFEKLLKPSDVSESARVDKELGTNRFGRKAAAIALAHLEYGVTEPDAVAKAVKQHWAPSVAEPTLKWVDVEKKVTKSLTIGSAAQAGAMVFPQYDPEWIQLLRNNTTIRGIARTIPMPRGSSTRRKQTGATTASYQGERGPIVPSDPTVGLVSLSYKKLTAACVVSNDLLRYGGPEVDALVQEDLLRVNALREDRAFLLGNPLSGLPAEVGSPVGTRYQTLAANVAAAAGVTLANYQTDITDLISLVEESNLPVSPDNSYIIMSPRQFWKIYALATTTGDMIFASMLNGAEPRLFGYRVLKTTQLSNTQLNTWAGSTGASLGMIAFVYAPALEIHDSMSRSIEVFRGGAYRDSSGTIQSGITNDETVITCISEHDFLQAYPEAAAFKTGYAQ